MAYSLTFLHLNNKKVIKRWNASWIWPTHTWWMRTVGEDLLKLEECMTDYCLMLPLYNWRTFKGQLSFVLAIGMQIKMKTPGHRHAMAKHNFMALLIWEGNYISEVMSLLKASRLTVEEAREQFLDNLVSDEAKEWVASIKEFKIQ